MEYLEKNLSEQPRPMATFNITSGFKPQFVPHTMGLLHALPDSSKALVYELVQGLIKVPKAHIRKTLPLSACSPSFLMFECLPQVMISWLPFTFLTATCVIRRFAYTFVPIWLVHTCSAISTRLTNTVINGMLAVGSSIPSRTLTSV